VCAAWPTQATSRRRLTRVAQNVHLTTIRLHSQRRIVGVITGCPAALLAPRVRIGSRCAIRVRPVVARRERRRTNCRCRGSTAHAMPGERPTRDATRFAPQNLAAKCNRSASRPPEISSLVHDVAASHVTPKIKVDTPHAPWRYIRRDVMTEDAHGPQICTATGVATPGS
jgi:hypothetical protein